MTEERKAGWLATQREKRQLKRERTGDSPEKAAQQARNREDKLKTELPNPELRGGFGEGGGTGG